MINRRLVCAAVLCLGFLGAGCGDDSPSGMAGSGTPMGTNRIRCTASVMPTTFNYTVMGDTLQLMDPATGLRMSAPRVAAGVAGLPVYGTWLLDSEDLADAPFAFHFDLKMKLEPNRASAIADCKTAKGNATATATSAATITESSVTTLESKTSEMDIYW